jgi:radical SAM superfamily enzyme YgiQ (UPF0313 family)
MPNLLFINPNRWGRGITTIWISAHAALLKNNGHKVKLFDSTFYKNWKQNETQYNTDNLQYKPTPYENLIKYNTNDIFSDLQNTIDKYKPDIIFGSAISSHIHGEGEYVNIQYYDELLSKISTNALRIAGGLQPTAKPEIMFEKFPNIDLFIRGESEFILLQISNMVNSKNDYLKLPGLAFKEYGEVKINPPQPILKNMDDLGYYDYSLFEEQAFFRPYNGEIIKAVDYELSRGCIYTCDYCVETVVQTYYGFDTSSAKGVLKNAQSYLRNKTAKHIFHELRTLNKEYDIQLIRCQDTNFLTIHKKVLTQLAELLDKSTLNIFLYIETRPEGINESTIKLLKKLKVDGVGMGIELASQDFREDKLSRFADQKKIINAFDLLKVNGIKRTAYNIIGVPEETETDIIDTIKFNAKLDPDNITVAFYSPYIGTAQEKKANTLNYFQDYERNVDGQLRTLNRSAEISSKTLRFYKKYFVHLVNNGLMDLNKLKRQNNV